MKALLAYHGKPSVKAKYLKRIRAHAKADEIVKGHYWQDGKGCAVGCTIHGSDHSSYETELGIPTWLARLEDGIFEALPNGKAQTFPERFLASIRPGANLAPVRDQFLAWLMDDPKFGLAHTASDAEVKALAAEVGRRLRAQEGLTGAAAEELSTKLRDARAARQDARDARRAAGTAWDAWASRATEDARDVWDARAAWDAGALAWDARAARAALIVASSEELLRLLRAAR